MTITTSIAGVCWTGSGPEVDHWSQRLSARGYPVCTSPAAADVVVRLDCPRPEIGGMRPGGPASAGGAAVDVLARTGRAAADVTMSTGDDGHRTVTLPTDVRAGNDA